MKQRSLDIIVPIYKNAELARLAIDSILAHLQEIEHARLRLILINDSPDDLAVDALLKGYAQRPESILILRNASNLGFVQSVNSGLAMAQREGRHALIVNSDTQTFPGTLGEVLAVAQADPQIAFVSPRSNNASICSLPHFDGGPLPTPAEAHRKWLALSRTLPRFHFSPTAVGFYMFIAHSVLANHGGLSEDFGVGYEEENDLVMRAGKQGYRAVIANHAFAFHASSASFALTGIDLSSHRDRNLRKMVERHPEFLPLVRRYQATPHHRAEQLMTGLLPDGTGRPSLVFDLTGLGRHHNGTNELALAVVRSMVSRWIDRFRFFGMGTADSFQFHGLDSLAGLSRVDADAPGLHALAIRFGQPFDLHEMNVLEAVAPINVFAMLDTIAEDCGPLAIQHDLATLWNHVARHANGLLFISRFSEQTFVTRHPDARGLPCVASLISTRLACYDRGLRPSGATHVLVLGNHFPHKGSALAVKQLSAGFPAHHFVVLGVEAYERDNVTSLRAGQLDPERMAALFAAAAAVVLPSHVEGFGLSFMHALAVGKPIVARRIPATEEILATLDDVTGVHLFENDLEIEGALTEALRSGASSARDSRAAGWDQWADQVAQLCLQLISADDTFDRLVRRGEAADLLRKAVMADRATGGTGVAAPPLAAKPENLARARAVDLATLLAMDGRAFVEQAYFSILRRQPDEGGVNYFTAELAAGVEKQAVLRMLALSPEGRAARPQLAGLGDLLR